MKWASDLTWQRTALPLTHIPQWVDAARLMIGLSHPAEMLPRETSCSHTQSPLLSAREFPLTLGGVSVGATNEPTSPIQPGRPGNLPVYAGLVKAINTPTA
jgi:hypothetical protein